MRTMIDMKDAKVDAHGKNDHYRPIACVSNHLFTTFRCIVFGIFIFCFFQHFLIPSVSPFNNRINRQSGNQAIIAIFVICYFIFCCIVYSLMHAVDLNALILCCYLTCVGSNIFGVALLSFFLAQCSSFPFTRNYFLIEYSSRKMFSKSVKNTVMKCDFHETIFFFLFTVINYYSSHTTIHDRRDYLTKWYTATMNKKKIQYLDLFNFWLLLLSHSSVIFLTL